MTKKYKLLAKKENKISSNSIGMIEWDHFGSQQKFPKKKAWKMASFDKKNMPHCNKHFAQTYSGQMALKWLKLRC